MRLAGYLKALKENSFAIPVYSENGKFFFHNVDENYKIIEFYDSGLENNNFIKCYLSTEFKINDFGAYVFVGSNNYLNYNILSKNIFEVENYLNDTTDKEKFLSVKEDVKSFINCFSSSDVDITNLNVLTIEEMLKLRADERKEKMRGYKYISWFTNEQEIKKPKNIDVVEILLEDSFNKFICEQEVMIEILRKDDDLKFKFIKHIAESDYNEEIKKNIFTKYLSIIYSFSNSSNRLKEHNYKFNDKKTIAAITYDDLFVHGAKIFEEESSKKNIEIAIRKIFEDEK